MTTSLPGLVTVTGAACGIDAAAHRAALASGRQSIAVMASGVDRPYPAGHRELMDEIADNGVLAVILGGAS